MHAGCPMTSERLRGLCHRLCHPAFLLGMCCSDWPLQASTPQMSTSQPAGIMPPLSRHRPACPLMLALRLWELLPLLAHKSQVHLAHCLKHAFLLHHSLLTQAPCKASLLTKVCLFGSSSRKRCTSSPVACCLIQDMLCTL